MKVDEIMAKIRIIDALIEGVAGDSLTPGMKTNLMDVLDEYRKLLGGMEVSTSQRIPASEWDDNYGA